MNERAKVNPPTEEWSFFGRHEHRFEPPDLYVSRLDGDVSADDVRVQLDALLALARRAGHAMYWLADVRNMGTIAPEGRRAMGAASSTEVREALAGSATFGAGFSKRVLVSLMARAVRVLHPEKSRPLIFVETEAEARAFLDEQRKR